MANPSSTQSRHSSAWGRHWRRSLGTLALVLGLTPLAQAAPTVIGENPPATLELQGVSGGVSLMSDCNAPLPQQSTQEIQLTDAFTKQSGFLRFSLEAGGAPLLILEGPAGRFCALGNGSAQEQAEVSGYWLPGLYKVYVGDRNHQSGPYKLSILSSQN